MRTNLGELADFIKLVNLYNKRQLSYIIKNQKVGSVDVWGLLYTLHIKEIS